MHTKFLIFITDTSLALQMFFQVPVKSTWRVNLKNMYKKMLPGPLLKAWFNLNSNIDKYLHP